MAIKKQFDRSVCWESSIQMTEHKKMSGHDPKSIFIEENVHIFREPTWKDVQNLYYSKFISEYQFENEDEVEVVSCK